MQLKHFFLYLFFVIAFLGFFYYQKSSVKSNAPIPVISKQNAEGSYTTTSGAPIVEDTKITILATGDIMLGRSVNTKIQKNQDFLLPAREVSFLFKDADISLTNLESPFHNPCPQTDKGMIFCADPRSIATLQSIGVTHANMANNHIGNYKQAGIDQTIKLLKENNITPVGLTSEQNKAQTIKGTNFVILGFNDVPPYLDSIHKLSADRLKEQLSKFTENDFIIVTIHWGNEYSKASARQKQLAHLAIDSGADLIIGHHPHWIQEIEEYKNKVIYYSLGNFIFDQMWSPETKEGIIAKIIVENGQIATHSAIPVTINNSYQPIIHTMPSFMLK